MLYLVCVGFVIGLVKLYFAVTVASLCKEVKLLEGHVAIRCTSFPNAVIDHILPLLL